MSTSQALNGVRIIDLSMGWAGPLACRHMADMGADVIKIEAPGGDIGRLAVCGTVNDLAMCGARPVALSAGFILEEGLPLEEVDRLTDSMAAAARETGVDIVAGDTKVVPRGKGDRVFAVTSGLGVVPPGRSLGDHRLGGRPGEHLGHRP